MKRFALLSLAILLLHVPAFAQQAASATLTGTITDAKDGFAQGATVTATHVATGIKRETTTNEDGFYVLSNLPSGVYTVRFKLYGAPTEVEMTGVSLKVGQTVTLNVPVHDLMVDPVTLDVKEYQPIIDTNTSLIDGVIDSRQVESLPLNGRNFLELALLVPGNAPAPNFDPTKTNTVVISSAGQLGRGGNVIVDGVDTNDDVVGGSMQNISQEAIREFQIVTNRFSAQLGRSGSSVINVLTKSGSNDLHGSGSFYFRDSSLQGLPATFDRTLDQSPPFDREQYAFAIGGPIKKDRAWFFGSFENRNQDGVVLVGTRDLATRSIQRGFADSPLDDLMTTNRVDFSPKQSDHLNFRYSFQRENGTTASTLVRSIGSASQRQSSENKSNTFLANYSHVFSANNVNDFNFSFSTCRNDTRSEHPGRRVVPRAATDQAAALSVQRHLHHRTRQSRVYSRRRSAAC